MRCVGLAYFVAESNFAKFCDSSLHSEPAGLGLRMMAICSPKKKERRRSHQNHLHGRGLCRKSWVLSAVWDWIWWFRARSSPRSNATSSVIVNYCSFPRCRSGFFCPTSLSIDLPQWSWRIFLCTLRPPSKAGAEGGGRRELFPALFPFVFF